MEDEKLIEYVRKYEYLYNVQHPKYRDTVKKDIAWKEISHQIKRPASACKQKWQGLRDAYRRALNKRKSKHGKAAKKNKKWKYEDEMSFVAPFFSERKTFDSVDFTSDDEGPDNYNETREMDHNTFENSNTDNEDNSTVAVDIADSHNTLGTGIQKELENAVKNNSPQHNQIKKAKKNVTVQTVQSASTVLMAKLLDEQNKLEPRREHDELDRFFLNMSETVKKFPPYQQALAKNKIFTLVSEMELQQLAPPSIASSSQYTLSNAYTPSPQSTTLVVPPGATPKPECPDN